LTLEMKISLLWWHFLNLSNQNWATHSRLWWKQTWVRVGMRLWEHYSTNKHLILELISVPNIAPGDNIWLDLEQKDEWMNIGHQHWFIETFLLDCSASSVLCCSFGFWLFSDLSLFISTWEPAMVFHPVYSRSVFIAFLS
jgi:hypothetical protein